MREWRRPGLDAQLPPNLAGGHEEASAVGPDDHFVDFIFKKNNLQRCAARYWIEDPQLVTVALSEPQRATRRILVLHFRM